MLLEIARRDRSAFDILVAAPDAPDESICFYAQQIVEKTMKAVLVSNSAVFRRTHDLLELARLVQLLNLPLPVMEDDLSRLNPCAVTLRYADAVVVLTIDRDSVRPIVDRVQHWAEELLEVSDRDQMSDC